MMHVQCNTSNIEKIDIINIFTLNVDCMGREIVIYLLG